MPTETRTAERTWDAEAASTWDAVATSVRDAAAVSLAIRRGVP
jgi:hypothetical protein